tara:strand:+ start:292 stop:690 length:399 start_codon:yes stop_codon:yes gene_type:complete
MTQLGTSNRRQLLYQDYCRAETFVERVIPKTLHEPLKTSDLITPFIAGMCAADDDFGLGFKATALYSAAAPMLEPRNDALFWREARNTTIATTIYALRKSLDSHNAVGIASASLIGAGAFIYCGLRLMQARD